MRRSAKEALLLSAVAIALPAPYGESTVSELGRENGGPPFEENAMQPVEVVQLVPRTMRR
ncbi:hypothetical protein MJA45_08285 [Paenibacillus aurantius]|uniref:Uncharacterized protein n=1 Tax=Paenibacillus aurantius TaxID=2918900 RepID=A0AA96LFU3_9BACL|nr:hypothetical protein [Paenibacillus aurantius]WNQ13011.1 hypothetical protein MJA45_08285 [Paenibacillus aurantius]